MEPGAGCAVDPRMKLLSPYSSWRERALTLAQIALLLALPVAVHFIFWSHAGIDATGTGLTQHQLELIHGAAEEAPQADAPLPAGFVVVVD